MRVISLSGGAHAEGAGSWARARLLPNRAFVTAVLVGYALTRLVAFVVLSIVAGHQVPTGMSGGDDVQVDYSHFMAMWDGQWYQTIAERGYPHELPIGPEGHVQQNPWAFYPMLPMVSRAVMAVTGLGFNVVASTVSLLCGFAAAFFMGLLLRDRIGDWPTVLVVTLWALFPASPTLQIAYTEAMAMLVLTAYLWVLQRGHWLTATVLAVLTGLTRPIAVPLGIVTLVACWVRWRRRGSEPIRPREGMSMLAALAGCGVAGLVWPTIAWLGTGVRSAYTDTMAAWRPYDSVQPLRPWIDRSRYFYGDLGVPLLVLIVLVLVALVAGPWARALGPQLRTWCLAYPAYLLAVLDPFTSIFRYLIPLFPLTAVGLGVAWRAQRPNVVVAVLWWIALATLSVVGMWYWTDILYRFSPPSDYPP